MKGKLYIFISLILVLSCSPKDNRSVEETHQWVLPSTPLFSQSSYWGVVSATYVKVYKEKNIESSVLSTLRRGDVLEIQRRDWDVPGESLWLYIVQQDLAGWVSAQNILIFDSPEQATTASKQRNQETE
ncbi:MAG: hypothetical protein PF447_09900 [Spirochaetaceae bacterium]|jgi:hypothetical protein|nr:hypothetical protein [Spirochaetaceae bacterium]